MNGWLSMVGSVLVLSLDIYRDGWLIDNSCRFLQSDQPSLRLDHRVLFTTVMSGDESDRRVGFSGLSKGGTNCS